MTQLEGLRTGLAPDAIMAESISYSVGDRVLLDNLSLGVPRGRSVAITGPSGSGKPTLLMVLAGLIPVAS